MLNGNNIRLVDLAGKDIWTFPYIVNAQGEKSIAIGPYDQEHIDLVTSIRTHKPINEAESTAISTMVGIMGRISAYTGKEVTFDEMMNSDMNLGPKTFVLGPVNDVSKELPIPGEAFVG